MRIISGCLKGRSIRFLPGKNVRPLTDKVREAIFSILGEAIKGALVLDLYAGSGSTGIEALSRGAEKVWFVDYNRKAVEIIKKNLSTTHFLKRACLRCAKVEDFLKRSRIPKFDIIFIDPPWAKVNWAIFDDLAKYLKPHGLIVLHLYKKTKRKKLSGFSELDRRFYGDHQIVFLRRDKYEKAG